MMPMAAILVIDVSETLSSELVQFLRRRKHGATGQTAEFFLRDTVEQSSSVGSEGLTRDTRVRELTMAAILLIDVWEVLSSGLAQFFRSHQHTVIVCHSTRVALKTLRPRHAAPDIIVLDMSHNHAKDWKTLEEIHNLLRSHPASPPILCLSTVYWGPRMQLAIERKGARFVYLQ